MNNLICECEEIDCDRPHNELELSMMEQSNIQQGEVGDDVYSLCPKCQNPSYEYEHNGVWIAFCDKCEKDWDLKTKEFLPDENLLKHKVYMGDDHIWHCTGCTLETWFMQEATNHERDKMAPLIEKKDDKVEELHYCKWVQEIQSQQCIYCKEKFDTWVLAEKHENAAGRKANNYTSNYVSTPHCSHPPKQMIDGKAWGVWVGRKYDCEAHLNEFDVVLNLTGNEVGKRHKIPNPEMAKWEGNTKCQEWVLDWPDRGVVSLPAEFWRELVVCLKKNNYKMLMFCIGGHGRTGTALASLFVIACGMEPRAALDKVHELHCKEAVESLKQEKYIWEMAGKLDKFEAKFEYKSTPTIHSNSNQTQLLGGY